MLLGTGTMAYLIPNSEYLSAWQTSKFIGQPEYYYIIYCVLVFCAGAALVSLCAPKVNPLPGSAVISKLRLPWRALWVTFYLSGILILIAYAIWLKTLLGSGLSISDLSAGLGGEAGASYDIRAEGDTIPGVTTFVQLEMGMFILGCILIFRFGWRKTFFTVLVPLGVIFFVAILRSKLWAERLALIEIGIPVLVLSARLGIPGGMGWAKRVLLAACPIVAPFIIFLFFAAAEYSRSWLTYYQYRQDSYLNFVFLRFIGYYATALNNGAAFVRVMHHYPIPFHTLDWFWRFPPVRSIFPYKAIANAEPWDDYHDLLVQMANPEFNNPSGVFVVRLDYGYWGGLFAWFGFGIVAMLLYRSFLKGSFSGLLLYPFFFIGLLESPRVFYWAAARGLPTWALLFAFLLLRLFWLNVQKARPVRQGLFRLSPIRKIGFRPAANIRRRMN
jgi:hypothetical protein